MIAISFSDKMEGSWHRPEAPADERPIAFEITATLPAITSLIGPAVARVTGFVRIDGVVERAEVTGTLGVGTAVRERRLSYSFTFTGTNGTRYRFDGTKELSVVELARSLSVLPGYLFDDQGHEVGRAVLRCDPDRMLWRFLRSIRLAKN